MVRGRLCLFVGVLAIGVAGPGCATARDLERGTIASEAKSTRPVAERQAALRVSTTTAAVSPAQAARTARPNPLPSPWQQYGGDLVGPSFTVAHARGAELLVSAAVGEPAIAALSNPTKVGAPRVALVVAEAGDWLQVLLPLRPNNSVGWVQRRDVDIASTALRVEIDRGERRLRVFDGDAMVMDETVAVGRSNTPTPTGQFFTTELLRPPNPAGAYGPFALTLSGYSTVFQRFGSGDGEIGVHGTNEPQLLGTEASLGCVRLSNEAMTRLAAMLPLGTPVAIR